jgi:hypothetical protein
LAAFWQQITPIGPFLPVFPVPKYFAVYNLGFNPLHGMEEVVGYLEVSVPNVDGLQCVSQKGSLA